MLSGDYLKKGGGMEKILLQIFSIGSFSRLARVAGDGLNQATD